MGWYINYLLLCNKLPHNLAAGNDKPVWSHHFCKLGIQEHLSCVILAELHLS